MTRFRADNTDGFTRAELNELNAAFAEIVNLHHSCGADWDRDSSADLSWQDHVAEELLSAYAAGHRGDGLINFFPV